MKDARDMTKEVQSESSIPAKLRSWSCTDLEEYEFSHRWTVSNFTFRTNHTYRVDLADHNSDSRTKARPGRDRLMSLERDITPVVSQSTSFSPEGKCDKWVMILTAERSTSMSWSRGQDDVRTNYIGIRLCLVEMEDCSQQAWMKYKVSIPSCRNSKDITKECTSYSEMCKGQQKSFDEFIEQETLLNPDNGYLVDDTVTIYCTISVKLPKHSTGVVPHVPVKEFQLGSKFNKARQKGLFTDVVLVASEKEFKAHQSVIALQSSFFNTRFQERWQQGGNRIEMTDISPSTLELMLDFMYTGDVGDLTSSSAGVLLAAAQEYGIEDLVLVCEWRLSQEVKKENVVSLLTLADTHRALHLKAVCIDFFVLHSSALLGSNEWKELKQSKQHEELRMEVLEEMLKRKT